MIYKPHIHWKGCIQG